MLFTVSVEGVLLCRIWGVRHLEGGLEGVFEGVYDVSVVYAYVARKQRPPE